MQITNPIFNSMAKSRLYFKLLGSAALPFLPAFESPTITCVHKIAVASLISQFNLPKDANAIIQHHLGNQVSYLNEATEFVLKDKPNHMLLQKLLTDSSYFKSISIAANQFCFLSRVKGPRDQCIFYLTKSHDEFHQIWNHPRMEKNLPSLKDAVAVLESITLLERLKSEQKLFEMLGVQAHKFLASGVRIDTSIYECIKALANIYSDCYDTNPAPMLQKLLDTHGIVLNEAVKLLDDTCQGRILNLYHPSAIPLFTNEAQAKILSKTRELKLNNYNVGDETQFTDVYFIIAKLENYMNYRLLNDDEIKECELFVAIFNDPILKSELLKKDKAPFIEILKNLNQVLNLKPNLTDRLDQCRLELNAATFAPLKFSDQTEQLILLILSRLIGYGKIPSDKMQSFFLDKEGILRTLELFKDNENLFDAEICTYIAILFNDPELINLLTKEDGIYYGEVMQNLKYILNNLAADKFPEDGLLKQYKDDLNR